MSSSDKVTIAVDAMGGDNAPSVVLEGVEAALKADENLEVILLGSAEVVEPFASLARPLHRARNDRSD